MGARASTSWGSTAARWNPGNTEATLPSALAEPARDATGARSDQSDNRATAPLAGTDRVDCGRSESGRARLGGLLPSRQLNAQVQRRGPLVHERLAKFLTKKVGRSGHQRRRYT